MSTVTIGGVAYEIVRIATAPQDEPRSLIFIRRPQGRTLYCTFNLNEGTSRIAARYSPPIRVGVS